MGTVRGNGDVTAHTGRVPNTGSIQTIAIPLQHAVSDRRRALLLSLEKTAELARDLAVGVELYGRIKSGPSAWEKMRRHGLRAHQILDALGIRAVTQDSHDCYRLVRRIHAQFPVLPNEYDDYIATPKPNGYRSLHTTVVGPCGLPIEIQVRTHAMHADAEHGAASHARYKRIAASGGARG